MEGMSTTNLEALMSPRCHASFSIIGSSLNFDDISAKLNQTTVKTARAGSKSVTGSLTEDVWSIVSPLDPKNPLQDHLQWLESQLRPHVDYLGALSRTARTRIYIGFTFSQEQNGFAISPEFVRLFASFNASIEMYILCNFGEDGR